MNKVNRDGGYDRDQGKRKGNNETVHCEIRYAAMNTFQSKKIATK
jgi:hypothetical protein